MWLPKKGLAWVPTPVQAVLPHSALPISCSALTTCSIDINLGSIHPVCISFIQRKPHSVCLEFTVESQSSTVLGTQCSIHITYSYYYKRSPYFWTQPKFVSKCVFGTIQKNLIQSLLPFHNICISKKSCIINNCIIKITAPGGKWV